MKKLLVSVILLLLLTFTVKSMYNLAELRNRSKAGQYGYRSDECVLFNKSCPKWHVISYTAVSDNFWLLKRKHRSYRYGKY